MKSLTNDAKYLLSSMYAIYIKNRKTGMAKSKARDFQSSHYIKQNIMPEWSEDDIFDTCLELKKYGYIEGVLADNSFYTLHLTTEAIAEMEVNFKDKIDKALDFAAKIKSAIPFL